MSLRILDAADESQRAAWTAAWEAFPDREVQAHPAYVERFTRDVDHVLAASWEDPCGAVLYPVVARPVRAEDWAADDDPRWDLVTPYGYGGPYRRGAPDPVAFWDAFDAWAADAGIVSQFARLSLFPDQLVPFRGEVVDVMPNVVRRLDLPPGDLWMDYAHKVRKNVKKARRSDLSVEVDEEGARLGAFLDIYYGTMDRRSAARGFYFDEGFFRAIVRELPGQFAFFHVWDDARIVSTELVLVSARHLYSFLGGTVRDAFRKRPNDLLKHAVVRWGMERGREAFVLGGGYGGEDGIFRYKKAFAPNGVVSFRAGRRVHDEEACEALLERRRAREAACGRTFEPAPGFFPAYRAPATAAPEDSEG
ncbi:MAG: GNAT family N-acetyltransferase [Myxococcota bacterium]